MVDLPNLPSADLAAVERLLTGAELIGAEVDTQYRVLALTIEPAHDRHPAPDADDPRLQVLLHPASVILAGLRREEPDGTRVVETFDIEQLPAVVGAFDIIVEPPVFGAAEPQAGEWGPTFSLEGRATAPDGRLHTFHVGTEQTFDSADGSALRVFDLFATFDHAEVRDPAGQSLDF